jgi:cysteamine dioxygenase
VLTPEAPTFCLRPNFANVHSFEAVGDCAVLDLLMPPYNDDAGRDCHYFAMVESGGAPADDTVMLRAAAPPDSLVIRGEPYLGPIVRSREQRAEGELVV